MLSQRSCEPGRPFSYFKPKELSHVHIAIRNRILNIHRIYPPLSRVMATSGKRKNQDDSSGSKKAGSGFWNQGLKAAMDDPAARVKADDQCVIIKDKYPKARYHYLVMPKRSINNLKALTPNDIPLLRHMYDVSKQLTEGLECGLEFRYGYHAIPSMSHVHLHVISQDFDSPSLKTKKHWNSFTSGYFIDSDDVIEMLDEFGEVDIDTGTYEQILKQNLKCHRCDKEFSMMPALKEHLLKHIPKDGKKPS